MKEKKIVVAHSLRVEELKPLLEYLKTRISSISPRSIESLEVIVDRERRELRIVLSKPWTLKVKVSAEEGLLEVKVTPLTRIGELYSETVLKLISSYIREYEHANSSGTIHLIFTDMMEFKSLRRLRFKEKMLSKMFSGTLTYLVISFMLIAILIVFFGLLAPLLLVGLHFTLLTFSDKLLLKVADWEITPSNRRIYVLSINAKKSVYESLVKTIMGRVVEVKKRIYNRAFKRGNGFNIGEAVRVLEEYGVDSRELDVKLKTIDLYDTVSSLGSKFGFKKPPKLGVLHTIIPNSAAVGLVPGKSSILVTSGIIALLKEGELKSVIAHELSHVKNRDPLHLSVIAASEYLARVYVLYPLLLPTWEALPILGLIYVLAILAIILFIAKFAEARADLEAAKIVKDPKLLAKALKKLGWRRLVFEEERKLKAWLRPDPHPPLYFRVKRLEELDIKKVDLNSKLYVRSAIECLREFFNTVFKG